MKSIKFIFVFIVFLGVLSACSTVAHPGVNAAKNTSAKDERTIARKQEGLLTAEHKRMKLKKTFFLFKPKKGGSSRGRNYNNNK